MRFKGGLLFLCAVLLNGIVFSQSDDTTKAQHDSVVNVYIDKCKKYIDNKDYNKSLDFAEKAVKIDKKNSNSYYWLGMAYGMKAQTASVFKKLSYAKKCRNAWSTALELDPQNADAVVALMNYYLQAPRIAGGNKGKARKLAHRLVDIDHVRGHMAMANIYEKEKAFNAAEAEYREVINLRPDEIWPYLNLGYFYQRWEKYNKSSTVFYDILKLDKQNMAAHYQIGKNAALSGEDLREGINHLRIYLTEKPGSRNPSWAGAHWRIGLIYQHLTKDDSARYEFQSALKLDPDFKEAIKALNSLNSN